MAAILKNRKIAISLQLLTALDEIWHSNACGPNAPDWALKFSDFENPISAILAILMKFDLMMDMRPPQPTGR